MAVPFMSRQSGFNNNNRFGNTRSLTPFQGGIGKVQPTPIGPGMSPGFRNAPSPQMTSALNSTQAPPAAPRVDGREAGIAAMRGYVNPAANGPTRPMRAPTGPGAVQSYGGLVGRGSITPRVPDVNNFNVSLDASGRPNGSPLAPTPPRVKATFTNPGASGPNPGLGGTKANGFNSNAFRDAQARLSQQKGFDGNGGDKSAEMPGGIPERAQEILRGQAESSQRNMKKYGTQDPQEASRAMWRERAFRQRNTAPRQAGYRNDPVAIQQMTDNYMGRGVDPRSMSAEPFRRADAEWARGSVAGQQPYVPPANSDNSNTDGLKPGNRSFMGYPLAPRTNTPTNQQPNKKKLIPNLRGVNK